MRLSGDRGGQQQSSVEVIEEFYGEPLTRSLLSKIVKTPHYQIIELAERLAELDPAPDKIRAFRATAGSGAATTPPPVIQDDTYLYAGRNRPLTHEPNLRHLILYSHNLILPDKVLDWALETTRDAQLVEQVLSEPELVSWLPPEFSSREEDGEEDARGLAKAVASLLPFVPLIKAGIVIPVAPPSSFRIDFDYGFGAVERPIGELMDLESDRHEIFSLDPYLRWVLANRAAVVEDWRFDAWQLDPDLEYDTAASEVLHQIETSPDGFYGLFGIGELAHEGATDAQVEGAATINYLCRNFALSPFVTDGVVQNHLARNSKITIEGSHALNVDLVDAGRSAIRFNFPDLSETTISDLTSLRLNEDAFDDVRQALLDLTQEVEKLQGIHDYSAFEREVHARAGDIIGPVYTKLDRQRRKARVVGGIRSHLSGGLISLGFNGLALMLSGPGAAISRAAGNSAGNAVKSAVSKKVAKNARGREVACSILISTLPPGNDYE